MWFTKKRNAENLLLTLGYEKSHSYYYKGKTFIPFEQTYTPLMVIRYLTKIAFNGRFKLNERKEFYQEKERIENYIQEQDRKQNTQK